MLLTGGESRRLGTDKATLTLADEPLWRRQIRLLSGLEPQAVWISARTRPAWCPPAVEVILDEPPSRGPLSGVAAALSRLQTPQLLALAVGVNTPDDLPQSGIPLT
jgi:molybdopterin-guanine dinucleotide biosynthesis protein A